MANGPVQHPENNKSPESFHLSEINQVIRDMYGKEAEKILAKHDFENIESGVNKVIVHALTHYDSVGIGKNRMTPLLQA